MKSLHQTLEYANLNKIIKNRKFEFPKRGTQLVEGSQVALPDHRLATSTWLGAFRSANVGVAGLFSLAEMPVRQSAPHSNGPERLSGKSAVVLRAVS